MNVSSKSNSKSNKRPKRDQLIALLGRKRAPTLAMMYVALGWQAHTTRAAISRLRSSGVSVDTLKNEHGRPTRYSLTSKPTLVVSVPERGVE
mgnify:FL=1